MWRRGRYAKKLFWFTMPEKAKQKIQSNPKRKESQQCLKMKGGS